MSVPLSSSSNSERYPFKGRESSASGGPVDIPPSAPPVAVGGRLPVGVDDPTTPGTEGGIACTGLLSLIPGGGDSIRPAAAGVGEEGTSPSSNPSVAARLRPVAAARPTLCTARSRP
jgi:hypothetical protein